MAKPITNAWSDDEESWLRACRALGMSFQQIANQYLPGRTASAAQYHFDAITKGRRSTYSPSDQPLPSNDSAHRAACERGSSRLLEAYVAYARRHYPDSDLARLVA